MDPDITLFKKQPCPFCGSSVDAATPPDGRPTRAPRDGDFMLCFTCAEPSVFRVTPLGEALVKPSPEEMAHFAVDHGHIAGRLRALRDRH